jgi:hypothetical protein
MYAKTGASSISHVSVSQKPKPIDSRVSVKLVFKRFGMVSTALLLGYRHHVHFTYLLIGAESADE